MAERCQRGFDEALLSGHLDGALTQAETQRVRLHLEGCAACRELLEQLSAIREAARGTELPLPASEDWPEAPRGRTSGLARGLGWMLAVVFLLGVAAAGTIHFLASSEPTWEKALAFGGLGGLGLLLLSVLLDRLHELGGDRYQRVKR